MMQTKGRKVRSPRASARRSTLKALTEIKRTVETMRGWWNIESVIYIPLDERPEGERDKPYRFRKLEEYPENQERYWYATISGIDKMIKDLQVLRDQCVTEYHETRGKQ